MRPTIRLLLVGYFLLIHASITLACKMDNTSLVYYLPFDAHTYLPVSKIGIEYRGKFVIKNEYFQEILNELTPALMDNFSENIRMLVFYNGEKYYINQQGIVELNNKIIGSVDRESIEKFIAGYGLYRWKNCQPLYKLLLKHKK